MAPVVGDATHSENCPECGAFVLGGRASCQALYESLVYEATQNLLLASVHALAFDTYCMQHVETYCVSAKSYVAHLTRLCVGVEYEGNAHVYAALQKWYGSTLTKPEVLYERGTIWMTDVHSQSTLDEKVSKVHEWAQDVWIAYGRQHLIARHWVTEALKSKRSLKRSEGESPEHLM